MKYQTISASSSVNLGNITYGGQTSYVQAEMHQLKEQRDKREYRDDLHHDLMTTMMQQQGDKVYSVSIGTILFLSSNPNFCTFLDKFKRNAHSLTLISHATVGNQMTSSDCKKLPECSIHHGAFRRERVKNYRYLVNIKAKH